MWEPRIWPPVTQRGQAPAQTMIIVITLPELFFLGRRNLWSSNNGAYGAWNIKYCRPIKKSKWKIFFLMSHQRGGASYKIFINSRNLVWAQLSLPVDVPIIAGNPLIPRAGLTMPMFTHPLSRIDPWLSTRASPACCCCGSYRSQAADTVLGWQPVIITWWPGYWPLACKVLLEKMKVNCVL